MFTYYLKFSNGKKRKAITNNLDECQAKAIPHLINEEDSVEIISGGRVVSRVIKRSSEYHWNHPGYFFTC